ncbi:MAG: hypothetical protein H6832_14440 [Planctomycetes bacterium]|nr:hypothetical protein [Planctomycetota bacterium]
MNRSSQRTSDWKTRLPRRIHWLLFVVLAVALYFGLFRRYRMTTIETPALSAMYADTTRARFIVDVSPSHAVPRDAIVWWEYRGATLFARVVGVPGDRFFVDADARWRREDDDGGRVFPPEVTFPQKLSNVVLAPGEYVLLADRPGTGLPDSTSLGIVEREAIVYRVLVRL